MCDIWQVMSPDWTFQSLICEMGIISHRVLDIMQVKCSAQYLAQQMSSMAAQKKPQTLLCCFCCYVWDPRGLAPPTSGSPGASDEYMLDLDNNPTGCAGFTLSFYRWGKYVPETLRPCLRPQPSRQPVQGSFTPSQGALLVPHSATT